MTRALLLLALVATGCAHVDRATLITSTVSLACDWGQTRSMAANDWAHPTGPQRYEEANPIMGKHPSTLVVDTYFMSAALINAAAWLVIPKGWRSAAPVAVTARQALAITRNVEHTGWCGL